MYTNRRKKSTSTFLLEHNCAPCDKTKMPRGTQSDILEGCCFLAGIILSWFRQSFRQKQTLTRYITKKEANSTFWLGESFMNRPIYHGIAKHMQTCFKEWRETTLMSLDKQQANASTS